MEKFSYNYPPFHHFLSQYWTECTIVAAMWRRLVSADLPTLAPCSPPARPPLPPILRRLTPLHHHHLPYAAVPPQSSALLSDDRVYLRRQEEYRRCNADGHERGELAADLEEAPAIVKSFCHVKSVLDKRIVGCPGVEGGDEHDVVWFCLEKRKPHECPVCSQYFNKLEVVGGPADGHGNDAHHH
ncbi:hypothetical protein RJ639_024881 [Escallonia herrerae]|uniref:Cytochrome c oxidase subunit Vb n=1 Tax=Escallonia herrerae TaxID=1293975 RepID=A0AA88UTP3_9ASTE|nr:hypothetical protein RJ639_024881 [Escallonia herrerae]